MKILIDVKKTKNPSEPYKLKMTIPTVGAKPNVCVVDCNSMNNVMHAIGNEMYKHKQDILEVALEEMKAAAKPQPKKMTPPKSPPKKAPPKPESTKKEVGDMPKKKKKGKAKPKPTNPRPY